MLRLRRSHARRESAPSLDMTPMIDMVFQLLVFFLLTSIVVSRPALEMVLPQAEHSRSSAHEEEIHLFIQKEGRIFLNQEEVPRERLHAALKKRIEGNPQKRLFLSADRAVPFQTFVYVLDVARGVGLLNLAIVTRTPEPDINGSQAGGVP